jgi:hypothetical protein
MKKLLEFCGLDRRRIALGHLDLNQPEQYIVLAESFIKLINDLGPIERSPEVQEKLGGLYATVNNSRVRWVLGATLRRPWEEVYPGNQRNARAFDEDLLGILKEEWMKARIVNLLSSDKRFFDLKELSQSLKADKEDVMEGLQEMVKEGAIRRVHKEGIAQYIV